MTIPESHFAQEMNWADYCDALSSEQIEKLISERRLLKNLERSAADAAREKAATARPGVPIN